MRFPRPTRFAMIGGLGAALLALAWPHPALAHRHHSRLHAHARASRQCADADAAVGSVPLAASQAALVCLTNQERTARGLPALRASERLERAAESWTQTMLATGDFGHGASFGARLTAVGYDWETAGENIATGITTPRGVVNAWMASPDHCTNILDPGFRDVGVGAADAAAPSWDTPAGTWTEDLGRLMGQSPGSGDTGPQWGCPYKT